MLAVSMCYPTSSRADDKHSPVKAVLVIARPAQSSSRQVSSARYGSQHGTAIPVSWYKFAWHCVRAVIAAVQQPRCSQSVGIDSLSVHVHVDGGHTNPGAFTKLVQTAVQPAL
jgi:hypothetical protein